MGNKGGKQKKKDKKEEDEETQKQTNGKVEDKPADEAANGKEGDKTGEDAAAANESKEEKGGGDGGGGETTEEKKTDDVNKTDDVKEADTAPELPVSAPPAVESFVPPKEEEKPLQNGPEEQTDEKVATEFRWEDEGESVLVTGSFNNWEEKVPLKKNGENVFLVTLDLPKGEHLYKFLVDDKWHVNKSMPTKVADDGLENNIINVC